MPLGSAGRAGRRTLMRSCTEFQGVPGSWGQRFARRPGGTDPGSASSATPHSRVSDCQMSNDTRSPQLPFPLPSIVRRAAHRAWDDIERGT
jgi:hypothetical protein